MSDVEGALRTVAVRPLAKGMYDDRVSQLIESGGGLDVQGYDVTPYGLSTSMGSVKVAVGDGSQDSPPIEFLLADEYASEIDTFTDVAGEVSMFCLSQHFIYRSSNLREWTPVPWVGDFPGGTYDVSGAPFIVSLAGLDTAGVAAGFYARIPTGVAGHSLRRVTGVDAAGFSWHSSELALTDYDDTRAIQFFYYFDVTAPDVVQYTRTPSFVAIVDGSGGGVLAFDGDATYRLALVNESNVAVSFTGARSVAFVAGRLVLGGTTESGGRLRVRWSSATNINEFFASDWADFVSAQGALIRLTSVEDFVVVLFEDSVAIGEPYGNDATYASPWKWRPLMTAGAAPVGPRAFCQIPNGIVFLGLDDVYSFTPLKRTEKGDFNVEALKCPVRQRLSAPRCADPTKVIMRYDPQRSRVVFALPSAGATYNDMLFWSLPTNEWSHRGIQGTTFTALGLFVSKLAETWSDWDDNYAGALGYWSAFTDSWGSYATSTVNTYFVGISTEVISGTAYGFITVFTRNTGTDEDYADGTLTTRTIRRVFETADYDFGVPDSMKAVRKLALRLRNERFNASGEPVDFNAAITFTVRASTDKGRTWKTLPDLTVSANADEGEVHFAVRSELVRFRLVTETPEPLWTLEELTMRVREAGRQIVRDAS